MRGGFPSPLLPCPVLYGFRYSDSTTGSTGGSHSALEPTPFRTPVFWPIGGFPRRRGLSTVNYQREDRWVLIKIGPPTLLSHPHIQRNEDTATQTQLVSKVFTKNTFEDVKNAHALKIFLSLTHIIRTHTDIQESSLYLLHRKTQKLKKGWPLL